MSALNGAAALRAMGPQSEPPGVAGASLQVAEGDLDDQLGPDVHRPRIAPHLAREKLPGLPVEHRVGEALEGLAEHDVLAGRRVEGTEVQVRELAAAAAVSPLGGQHD